MAFTKKHLTTTALVLSCVALVIGIIFGVLSITALWRGASAGGQDMPGLVDSSTFQAVFLDNSQVYFGHLSEVDTSYPVLSDVYYVQLTEATAGQKNTSGQNQGRLVRLGDIESHGPRNQIILSREHILFWENMKPTSQVMQAIQNYK